MNWMPKKYGIFVICALLVGGSLGYMLRSNVTLTREAESFNLSSPTPTKAVKATPIAVEQTSYLQDRDSLLLFMARVHDGEGFEYTESQLKELQSNPDHQDYRKVLQKFAQSRLKQEICSFQTIGKPVNPRTLLVTTKDQHAYLVTMRKDYLHDGIWLVSGLKEYIPQGDPFTQSYKIITLATAPGEVKAWAQAFLEQPEWKKEFKTFGDRTYVFIKSSSSYSDSVELEDVSIFAGEANIAYQSYQYAENSEKGLINDYLLFEILIPNIREVLFQNTYSNFPIEAGKEPVPGDESTIAHLKNKLILDAKFMEIAAMGKVRGMEFGIGTSQEEVIGKWGKPHEIGSRQVQFQRWFNYQMYFDPTDHRLGAIRVMGESVAYTLPEVKKALGNPIHEINGEDGVWSLLYESGPYQLYVNALSKDGQVESLMLKKKD